MVPCRVLLVRGTLVSEQKQHSDLKLLSAILFALSRQS